MALRTARKVSLQRRRLDAGLGASMLFFHKFEINNYSTFENYGFSLKFILNKFEMHFSVFESKTSPKVNLNKKSSFFIVVADLDPLGHSFKIILITPIMIKLIFAGTHLSLLK